ncbi:MAG: MBL fold metallo-hydrolase [Candidatus Vogelbacteria bacterium]|nr:MBL fold metallo-hydrolase [Candidatus Vogelbacteria bacterium]
MSNKLELTFNDGVDSVTGANFVLRDDAGFTIMFDCGLVQGSQVAEDQNYDKFPFDPTKVDFLFVSHAHLDHIGRIPKLVKEGFRGRIISTPPTKEIAELMLIDSMGVLEKEARGTNREQLYTADDVAKSMSLWDTRGYHEEFSAGKFRVLLKDAGHILGSSMTEISLGGKKLLYTGDLGNSPEPLLRDTEPVGDVDYLIMESVYGDRLHEHREDRQRMLADVVMQTFNKKANLMIPVFSLERTQELLFELRMMVENGLLPPVPVYLDSPLAIKVTSVYNKYTDYLNVDAMRKLTGGKDLFGYRWIHKVIDTEESKKLRELPGPKIIMAGSGMSNGGRIIHHEKNYLPDPNNTLLLVGYQAVRTLGRILQDGAKHVKILGEDVPVNARVLTISGYSAHRDRDGLFDFVAGGVDTLERVFVAMGEPKSSLYLVQRIRDNLGLNAESPTRGETVSLDFN